MITPKTITTKQVLLLLIAFVLLSGCETGGYATGSSEQRAETLARNGEHASAADAYIGLATTASGSERDRLTMLAVEQWLDAGDGRRARSALRGVSKPTGGELLWLWNLDVAAIYLIEGRPDKALSILEPMSREPLTLRYRSRAEALRADAWFQKNEPAKAVILYMQRENWLDGSLDIERNRQRLWAGLLVSDALVMRSAADINADPEVQGWLRLGALAASTGQQGIGWSNGVVRWQQSYAGHPGIAIIEGMDLPDASLLDFPRQIALLLPISGKNATAGKAVQNGFFGAYFAAAPGLEDEQRVAVYDIARGGVAAAYAQALEDGAEFVIGPLLRRNVQTLAREPMLPVPILSLNYLPDEMAAPPGFFQFALAPEDEAASAATRALADGAVKAVALYPDNDWGRRVMNSFANELEGNGGLLLDHRSYQTGTQDFSIEIENLMALSQSVSRYKRLRANLGLPLQFDPRRRQDVDFVFLAADAKAGRLIKSQLKFHYAGELPVYSTSFIYSMDGRSNSDLNGIMFADTPWIIAPPTWIAGYPQLYSEFWPAEKRMGRLHAMGYDAYNLVSHLYSSSDRLQQEYVGATGRLYLDSDGRVHRRLSWAQFERGELVPLPDTDELIESPDEDALNGQPTEWPSHQLRQ
jgi:outer membrane PBP1 activator LpoA protein